MKLLSIDGDKCKLQVLEKSYQKAKNDHEDEHLREIELESLTRLINQLKEEIARYECRQEVRP